MVAMASNDNPPPPPPDSKGSEAESFLLGVGLDGRDGHRRITKGDGFHLQGGSEETHDRMQETVIKVVEKLERKGRGIPDSSAEELSDLLREQTDRNR